jgi:MFS family permease
MLLASLGFLLFAASRDYTCYLLAAAVLGLGTGLGGPLPPAYAIQVGGRAGHGLVMGTLRFLGDVGFMAGPVALGLVADAGGYREALLANAALMVGVVVLFGLLASEPPRPARRREVLPKGNCTRSI